MMRMTRLVCCGAAALFVLGLARPQALQDQTPPAGQSQPLFKSSTALVEVDATILDAQDHFVKGLIADDVELFEDGKPQKIQQFFMVSYDGAAAPIAGAGAGSDNPEDRAHRVFVVVFDESHLAVESLIRAKIGAEQFLRDQMTPGDVGGVFVNDGMYKGRLTTDKYELISAVRSVRPAFDNRQALLASFRQFPRISGEIDAARIADGAQQVVDRLGVAACAEDPFDCQLQGGLNQVENLLQQKARSYIGQARVLTAQTLTNLEYIANGLARFPGRKTVMFLSEGFYMEESRAQVQTIAAKAARGGTTIYSIDARGLVSGNSPNTDAVMPERARATTFDSGEDGPTILADGTGGFRVHGIDDLSRAFGLVVRDTSTYYVIGYQPDNSVMDGKFRKISVKSKVPNLHVRARNGYLAVALPPPDKWSGGWK
jgi:VWFA-related protein